MKTTAQLSRTLLPSRLTVAARRVAAVDFVQRTGCRAVLLLRVPAQEQELAWGLHQTYGIESEVVSEQPKVLDFQTAVDVEDQPARGTVPRKALTRNFAVDDLINWMGAAPCFALPLQQREGVYSGRISLGRARNKDLYLRSQNISKLHAWFEYDAAGKLFVADAGSKNGTKAGGVQLTPREPVAVTNGMELKFGPISAVVCSVEQFWEVASAV